MDIPTVTIVGRPNVGKSSLLNCLARRRIAIVDSTSGVTRDRVSALIQHAGKVFELIDTGGIGIPAPEEIAAEVEAQIRVALERADLILFVVDAKEGIMPLDEKIARSLRPQGKAVILVVNKVDSRKEDAAVPAFHELGFGEPSPISALHRTGRTDLLDRIVRMLPERTAHIEEPALKIAIVGKQNVGKSTMINTLAREERVIVSETPGTTRDSVDVEFELEGKRFVAIDTAGIKKKKRLRDSIEFYSLCRSERAIRRCDVALLMLDAATEITNVDKQIARYIEEHVKPCVIVTNKWDLAEERGIEPERYVEYIRAKLPGLDYAPLSFTSAMTGKNVLETVKLAEELHEQAKRRVPTAELNRVIEEVQKARPPERKRNKQPKIFYGTQVGVTPPTIVLFAKHHDLITKNYLRYLANSFRKHLPFPEIPIRIYLRPKRSQSS